MCAATGATITITPRGGGSTNVMPTCPSQLNGALAPVDSQGRLVYQLKINHNPMTQVDDHVDARIWAARGAINAAAAVFLYLDAVERGNVTPQPPYNQCEKR